MQTCHFCMILCLHALSRDVFKFGVNMSSNSGVNISSIMVQTRRQASYELQTLFLYAFKQKNVCFTNSVNMIATWCWCKHMFKYAVNKFSNLVWINLQTQRKHFIQRCINISWHVLKHAETCFKYLGNTIIIQSTSFQVYK